MKNRVLKAISLALCFIFTMNTVCSSAPSVYSIKVPEKYGKVRERWLAPEALDGSRKKEVGSPSTMLRTSGGENLVPTYPPSRGRYQGVEELSKCNQSTLQGLDTSFANEDCVVTYHSQKTVIHIQDAHTSFEAQENIAKIISSIADQVGGESEEDKRQKTVDNRPTSRDCADGAEVLSKSMVNGLGSVVSNKLLIGVEGAVGDVPIEKFRSFPVTEARDKTAYDYMKKGIFSGVEYAGITGSEDWQFYGIEDQKLFMKDFNDYYHAVNACDEVAACVDEMARVFAAVNKNMTDESLPAFHEAYVRFHTNDNDLLTFLPILYDAAVKCDIDLYDYTYVTVLHEKLAEQGAEDKSFSLLDVPMLLREVDELAYAIMLALAANDDERMLIRNEHALAIIKKVAMLEGERSDVESFQNIDVEQVVATATRYAEQYGIPFDSEKVREQCLGTKERVDDFYQYAIKRDEAFVNNLLAKMDADGKETAVLVSGGFHSDGIAEILRTRGINYLTVTPNMSSAAQDIPFHDLMTGKLFPLKTELTSTLRGLAMFIHENLTKLTVDFSNDALLKALQLITSGAAFRDEIETALRKLENTGSLGTYTADEETFYHLVCQINQRFMTLTTRLTKDFGNATFSQEDVWAAIHQDEYEAIADLVKGFYENRDTGVAESDEGTLSWENTLDQPLLKGDLLNVRKLWAIVQKLAMLCCENEEEYNRVIEYPVELFGSALEIAQDGWVNVNTISDVDMTIPRMPNDFHYVVQNRLHEMLLLYSSSEIEKIETNESEEKDFTVFMHGCAVDLQLIEGTSDFGISYSKLSNRSMYILNEVNNVTLTMAPQYQIFIVKKMIPLLRWIGDADWVTYVKYCDKNNEMSEEVLKELKEKADEVRNAMFISSKRLVELDNEAVLAKVFEVPQDIVFGYPEYEVFVHSCKAAGSGTDAGVRGFSPHYFSSFGSFMAAGILLGLGSMIAGLLMSDAGGQMSWAIAKEIAWTVMPAGFAGAVFALFGFDAADTDGKIWRWMARIGLLRGGPEWELIEGLSLIATYPPSRGRYQGGEDLPYVDTPSTLHGRPSFTDQHGIIHVDVDFMQKRPPFAQKFYLFHERIHRFLFRKGIKNKFVHEVCAYGVVALGGMVVVSVAAVLRRMVSGSSFSVALKRGTVLAVSTVVFFMALLAPVHAKKYDWESGQYGSITVQGESVMMALIHDSLDAVSHDTLSPEKFVRHLKANRINYALEYRGSAIVRVTILAEDETTPYAPDAYQQDYATIDVLSATAEDLTHMQAEMLFEKLSDLSEEQYKEITRDRFSEYLLFSSSDVLEKMIGYDGGRSLINIIKSWKKEPTFFAGIITTLENPSLAVEFLREVQRDPDSKVQSSAYDAVTGIALPQYPLFEQILQTIDESKWLGSVSLGQSEAHEKVREYIQLQYGPHDFELVTRVNEVKSHVKISVNILEKKQAIERDGGGFSHYLEVATLSHTLFQRQLYLERTQEPHQKETVPDSSEAMIDTDGMVYLHNAVAFINGSEAEEDVREFVELCLTTGVEQILSVVPEKIAGLPNEEVWWETFAAYGLVEETVSDSLNDDSQNASLENRDGLQEESTVREDRENSIVAAERFSVKNVGKDTAHWVDDPWWQTESDGVIPQEGIRGKEKIPGTLPAVTSEANENTVHGSGLFRFIIDLIFFGALGGIAGWWYAGRAADENRHRNFSRYDEGAVEIKALVTVTILAGTSMLFSAAIKYIPSIYGLFTAITSLPWWVFVAAVIVVQVGYVACQLIRDAEREQVTNVSRRTLVKAGLIGAVAMGAGISLLSTREEKGVGKAGRYDGRVGLLFERIRKHVKDERESRTIRSEAIRNLLKINDHDSSLSDAAEALETIVKNSDGYQFPPFVRAEVVEALLSYRIEKQTQSFYDSTQIDALALSFNDFFEYYLKADYDVVLTDAIVRCYFCYSLKINYDAKRYAQAVHRYLENMHALLASDKYAIASMSLYKCFRIASFSSFVDGELMQVTAKKMCGAIERLLSQKNNDKKIFQDLVFGVCALMDMDKIAPFTDEYVKSAIFHFRKYVYDNGITLSVRQDLCSLVSRLCRELSYSEQMSFLVTLCGSADNEEEVQAYVNLLAGKGEQWIGAVMEALVLRLFDVTVGEYAMQNILRIIVHPDFERLYGVLNAAVGAGTVWSLASSCSYNIEKWNLEYSDENIKEVLNRIVVTLQNEMFPREIMGKSVDKLLVINGTEKRFNDLSSEIVRCAKASGMPANKVHVVEKEKDDLYRALKQCLLDHEGPVSIIVNDHGKASHASDIHVLELVKLLFLRARKGYSLSNVSILFLSCYSFNYVNYVTRILRAVQWIGRMVSRPVGMPFVYTEGNNNAYVVANPESNFFYSRRKNNGALTVEELYRYQDNKDFFAVNNPSMHYYLDKEIGGKVRDSIMLAELNANNNAADIAMGAGAIAGVKPQKNEKTAVMVFEQADNLSGGFTNEDIREGTMLPSMDTRQLFTEKYLRELKMIMQKADLDDAAFGRFLGGCAVDAQNGERVSLYLAEGIVVDENYATIYHPLFEKFGFSPQPVTVDFENGVRILRRQDGSVVADEEKEKGVLFVTPNEYAGMRSVFGNRVVAIDLSSPDIQSAIIGLLSDIRSAVFDGDAPLGLIDPATFAIRSEEITQRMQAVQAREMMRKSA